MGCCFCLHVLTETGKCAGKLNGSQGASKVVGKAPMYSFICIMVDVYVTADQLK